MEVFQTEPTNLDGDSLCQTEEYPPLPPRKCVRGALWVEKAALEFLILTVCKVPGCLMQKTAALHCMGFSGELECMQL